MNTAFEIRAALSFCHMLSGIGAAALDALADRTDIFFVYRLCSYLPAIGGLALWLPRVEATALRHEPLSAVAPGLEPAGD